MERESRACKNTLGNDHPEIVLKSSSESMADSVMTEALLDELKRQSPAGCLLCAIDGLDDEDWD